MGGPISTFAINQSGLNGMFAKLYSTPDKIKQLMVSVKLDSSRLDFRLAPEQYWHDILVRADSYNKVRILIIKASKEHEEYANELAEAYLVYKDSREIPSQGMTNSGVIGDEIGSVHSPSGGIIIGRDTSDVEGQQGIVMGDLVGGAKIGTIENSGIVIGADASASVNIQHGMAAAEDPDKQALKKLIEELEAALSNVPATHAESAEAVAQTTEALVAMAESESQIKQCFKLMVKV